MEELKKARDEALAAHELARVKMAERFTGNFKPFVVNDKVWLDSKNLRTKKYFSKKFAPKREGPFRIKEVVGPLTYRLDLPKSWKIANVFHAILLRPYTETEVHGPNYTNPPPDVIDNIQEYEVEAIISHKRFRGKIRYLVKWKGYPTSENSYQYSTDLKNAKDILDEYKKRKKL